VNEEFKEKIRKDERLRIYEALKALGIINYSIPEDFWFLSLEGGIIGLDKWIEEWESSKPSTKE